MQRWIFINCSLFLGFILFAFIAGCGQSSIKKQANNTEVQNDTSLNGSMSGKNKESEEWNFDIIPPKVGLISTRNHISEISGLLPTNYHMVKDSTILEPVSEEYIIYYAIRENNKTLLEIHPKENGKEIFSIVVLSSEYEIKNTVLRVGSTFGTLKKTFSIKDSYFNFTDGLYIFCDGFDGAFSIDLEGEGDDSPELLDLLPESRKIETIVVY